MHKHLHAPMGPIVPALPGAWRRPAARMLRRIAHWLASVAHRLQRAPVRQRGAAHTVLEFYAEAGAPEGALYVDGELVGHLPGVSRL